jgi:hypothetical protein
VRGERGAPLGGASLSHKVTVEKKAASRRNRARRGKTAAATTDLVVRIGDAHHIDARHGPEDRA